MKRSTTIVFLLLILIGIKAQTTNEIWKLYSNKDLENTIKSGQQVLKNDQDNPQVNSVVGRALADLKKT